MQPVAFLFDGVFAYTHQRRNSSHYLLSEEVLHQTVKKFVGSCRKFIVRERSSECCQMRGEASTLVRGYLVLL